MKPVCPNGKSWRIEMPDGQLVGWYLTKKQAEAGIAKKERAA